jgi:LPXTG-site transpeptidase (sortase) family protein
MNKKFFLLAAFAIFVLLFSAFPVSAQTSIDWGHVRVTPLSGNWNYPGFFVLEALKAPISVEWEIKCSYGPCPRDEEYGSHTFTYVGESILVGWGHQCYAWQFDPIGRTGFIAEPEPWLCQEPTPTQPVPTTTPITQVDTPTPTATPEEPTPTPITPAETPPGFTPTPGEPTPTPPGFTPTPAEQTPPPGQTTPTPAGPTPTPGGHTPTPVTTEDTPTPVPPAGGQEAGPTPTPRLNLPVTGEMPILPLSSPILPALAALLLLGLAGRTVWTGILQAERSQIPATLSPDLRTHARNVLILIGLSLLILAYLVWSSLGSTVPADLRGAGASIPLGAAPVQEQAQAAVGLLQAGVPAAITTGEGQTSPAGVSVQSTYSSEALAGSNSMEDLFIPVLGGSTAGEGRAAYSALAGAYREDSPPDASPVIRLVIPALKVEAEVHHIPFENETWDVSELGLDIAWLGGTSSPGLGSNTVLAGHVTTVYQGNGPFRYLARLQAGDLVQVYTEWNIYTYAVREQMVVKSNDSRVVGATEEAQLTLITCTGWNDDDRGYTSRRTVFADLVGVEALAENGERWR